MKRSTDRIRTTHTGSLPRPVEIHTKMFRGCYRTVAWEKLKALGEGARIASRRLSSRNWPIRAAQ